MKDELDVSIKKLMRSMHGEEVDEKIESKLSELRSEIESKKSGPDIAPLIASIRESRERMDRIESAISKMGSRKPDDRLLPLVHSEIDKLSSGIREELAKQKDMVEDLHSQIAGIRDVFKEMRELHELMKSVDVKGIGREMEAIKQKLAWLEQQSGLQDLELLKERVEELESRIGGIRSGSPLVIE